MPGILRFGFVNIIILALISFLAFIYGYKIYLKEYKKYNDVLPALSITIALAIDSLLTQVTFIPLVL